MNQDNDRGNKSFGSIFFVLLFQEIFLFITVVHVSRSLNVIYQRTVTIGVEIVI